MPLSDQHEFASVVASQAIRARLQRRKNTMNQEKKLIDLVQDFDTAMLTTKNPEGRLDSRPMAIAECTDAGKLWFVTDARSGKVAEIQQDHEVAVTMQSRNQFV